MTLRFHPAVQHDINEVLTYYQTSQAVKITCVKHEKRHPLRGQLRR